jgi:uncharacterized iron-regulated membrane protein
MRRSTSTPTAQKVLGERRWGEPGATRAHLVPMLYRLHMSLFLEEPGQWITATVAAVWIVMLLVGIFIAVPRLRLLGKALRIRWRARRARTLFVLHRAAGLALGWLLAVIAFTGKERRQTSSESGSSRCTAARGSACPAESRSARPGCCHWY